MIASTGTSIIGSTEAGVIGSTCCSPIGSASRGVWRLSGQFDRGGRSSNASTDPSRTNLVGFPSTK
jgi:hypothetical protein